MKIFKIKSPFLKGSLSTIASIDNNILTIMDITRGMETDEPLMDNEIIYNDIRSMIISKIEVDINSIITGKPDHSVISVYKNKEDKLSYIFEVYPKTINGRLSMKNITDMDARNIAVHLFIPFTNSTLEECSIAIPESETGSVTLEDNLIFQQEEFVSFEDAADFILPSLQISEPIIIDGILNATVTLVNNTGEVISNEATVYVESTLGYLLTPRIDLIDGVGKILVSVSGLPEGCYGKIKAGFRYYPGKTELKFEV